MDQQTQKWIDELLDRISSEQSGRLADLLAENTRLLAVNRQERDENRRLWAAVGKLQHATGVLRAGGADWDDEAIVELDAADELLDGLVPLTPA